MKLILGSRFPKKRQEGLRIDRLEQHFGKVKA